MGPWSRCVWEEQKKEEFWEYCLMKKDRIYLAFVRFCEFNKSYTNYIQVMHSCIYAKTNENSVTTPTLRDVRASSLTDEVNEIITIAKWMYWHKFEDNLKRKNNNRLRCVYNLLPNLDSWLFTSCVAEQRRLSAQTAGVFIASDGNSSLR